MTDFRPDPTNYVMRGNAPRDAPPPSLDVDLALLNTLLDMPRIELESLLKRVMLACWGDTGLTGQHALKTALMSDDDIAEAAKLRFATAGLNTKEMFKALPLLREWFDRAKGKPAQSIAMTVEDKGITKLSDERLLNLERNLARMTGQEAIVIAPAPTRISSTDNQ